MPKEPANILIVDDEPGPRESLRMVLQEDYHVTCVSDGRAALQVVKTRPVDLVTLDLRLPGLDGTDLLREIKALDPNIEVIVVTGYGDLQSAMESIHHGVFDYVTKPFNIAEIKMAVAKSLERRRLNVELARFFGELEAEEAGSLQEALGAARTLRDQMVRTERLSTVGLMTAGFIHEINNPLASVVALAELALTRLRQGGRETPERSEAELCLQKIIRESKRISRLAAKMLGLARENPQAAPGPTEPAALVEEALELVRPQASRKGLKLQWSRPAQPLPQIPCDADQLKQVLLNLLINAVQATPAGGRVRVALSAQVSGGGQQVLAKITDNGCGIDPENLSKIFEPFFTTKGEGEGTGLGLYICRQIVQRCGGTLEVASQPGRGTSFTLHLPASQGLAPGPLSGPLSRS
jgi:signal transduction histidine kinase